MPGDLNIVLLTGQIITEPIKSRLNYQKTPMASFTLQCNEYYRDSVSGASTYHPNIFSIQTLGRNAESISDRFVKGMRVYVEGYVRSDEDKSNPFCIRTHAIRNEETLYAQKYYEGVEHALEVLKTSRDKGSAVEALTKILGANI
jgi:primosomal replication protein N